jgi:hypothetical protein
MRVLSHVTRRNGLSLTNHVQSFTARLSTNSSTAFGLEQAQPAWFKKMLNTNEYNLPRLPIPNLGDTLGRYLQTIKPLVSPKEFIEHQELAKQFQENEGRKLQDFLLKRELSQAMSNSYPFSYIEADWDKMYLGGRYESPINVNPTYGLVSEKEAHLKQVIPRTAAFVHSLLKWWNKVKSEQLEQDPKQCMFSFARQLGTAKIAKKERDILVSSPRSSHIVVIRGNQFYRVELLSTDGKQLLSTKSLEERLNHILNDSSKPDYDVDLSVLTAENRDNWAQIRNDLIAHDSVNKESLSAIDSALFVLVLEDRAPNSTVELSELSLHGKGGHRWFDKLQLIAYPDGNLATNFEHSFSDGTTWNRWLHEVWHDMRGSDSGFSSLQELPEYESSKKPTPLKWKLSNNLMEEVNKAQSNYSKFCANLATDFLEYKSFAKNNCKEWKLSPDGVVQMAFQLAFHRAHGKIAPTYESCSTRGFLHGRTETIRSASNEAAAFAKSVISGAEEGTQRELMVNAINKHVDIAKTAQKGLGVDRHLLALSSIANENGIKSEFLQSPIRALSTNFQISSSNVTMPFLHYFSFGAVVPDGYGLGYLIHSKSINVSLTNFKSSQVTDVKKFKKSLESSLDMIHKLAGSSPAP